MLTYARNLGTFRKKLEDLCRTSVPRQVLMEITPDMAAIMFEHRRENNRNISNRRVAQLAAVIREEQFGVTNQGIGFDTDGRLIDGQHRLAAVIESGLPIVIWVAFGIAPENFMHIDQGGLRTAGQVVGMAGFANSNVIAAAARFAYLLELDDLSMSWTRMGVLSKSEKNRNVTPEMMVEFLGKMPSLVRLGSNYAMYKEFIPLEASSAWTMHWHFRRKYVGQADQFMKMFCEGTNLKAGGPIIKVRKRLVKARQFKERIPKIIKAAWVAKAFNAWNKDKPLEQFKIGATEGFPKVK